MGDTIHLPIIAQLQSHPPTARHAKNDRVVSNRTPIAERKKLIIKKKSMTLEHFYSDWNGQTSKTPYLKKPTTTQIKEATEKGICRTEKTLIFAGEGIVEVRTKTGDGYSKNVYRDMYMVK